MPFPRHVGAAAGTLFLRTLPYKKNCRKVLPFAAALCLLPANPERMRACIKHALEFWFNQSVCISFSLIYYVHFFGFRILEYEEIMPQQFHLDAGVLRIHGLHAEAFGTDNLDLLVILHFLDRKSVV